MKTFSAEKLPGPLPPPGGNRPNHCRDTPRTVGRTTPCSVMEDCPQAWGAGTLEDRCCPCYLSQLQMEALSWGERGKPLGKTEGKSQRPKDRGTLPSWVKGRLASCPCPFCLPHLSGWKRKMGLQRSRFGGGKRAGLRRSSTRALGGWEGKQKECGELAQLGQDRGLRRWAMGCVP